MQHGAEALRTHSLCDATWGLSTLTKMKSLIGIFTALFSTSCLASAEYYEREDPMTDVKTVGFSLEGATTKFS